MAPRLRMTRKPARSWTARLAVFSEKIPDRMAQIPACSVESISALSRAEAISRTRAEGSTWTECSMTPAYAHRSEPPFAAARSSTAPLATASPSAC